PVLRRPSEPAAVTGEVKYYFKSPVMQRGIRELPLLYKNSSSVPSHTFSRLLSGRKPFDKVRRICPINRIPFDANQRATIARGNPNRSISTYYLHSSYIHIL
ncbi:MAG: hypothetical protein WAN14_10500, partial [Candidatus Acidiferrales bacterium]